MRGDRFTGLGPMDAVAGAVGGAARQEVCPAACRSMRGMVLVRSSQTFGEMHVVFQYRDAPWVSAGGRCPARNVKRASEAYPTVAVIRMTVYPMTARGSVPQDRFR